MRELLALRERGGHRAVRRQLTERVALRLEPRWWPLLCWYRLGPALGGGFCLMAGPLTLDVRDDQT